MTRHAIHTDHAPRALGPYSQAIVANGLVFCAGQLGLDPTTGMMVAGDASDQARQALDNLRAVLASAGTDLSHAVKVTLFLLDLADFSAVNAVYAEYMVEPAPARSTVEVSRLPAAARVEIDVIATLPGGIG
jgi:2-iminobutanoate/2-iminopropanoate deaminase